LTAELSHQLLKQLLRVRLALSFSAALAPCYLLPCLPELAYCSACRLAESSQGLSRAPRELANGAALTERLTGRVCQSSERLTGGATRPNCFLCGLPDISERLADRASRTERLLAQVA
jgi:hypothetical protein